MKSELTEQLEKSIRKLTTKMGTFGCSEVTIGFGGKEQVDYMTYDTKGIFRCYEIKSSKEDFYSKCKHTFLGHYNYYVMNNELYEQVKNDIPKGIGVYCGGYCIVKPKKQELEIDKDILLESMVRSLYRDSEKLYKLGDEQYINRLKNQVHIEKENVSYYMKKYTDLYVLLCDKFGRKWLRDLLKDNS